MRPMIPVDSRIVTDRSAQDNDKALIAALDVKHQLPRTFHRLLEIPHGPGRLPVGLMDDVPWLEPCTKSIGGRIHLFDQHPFGNTRRIDITEKNTRELGIHLGTLKG